RSTTMTGASPSRASRVARSAPVARPLAATSASTLVPARARGTLGPAPSTIPNSRGTTRRCSRRTISGLPTQPAMMTRELLLLLQTNEQLRTRVHGPDLVLARSGAHAGSLERLPGSEQWAAGLSPRIEQRERREHDHVPRLPNVADRLRRVRLYRSA